MYIPSYVLFYVVKSENRLFISCKRIILLPIIDFDV